MWRTGKYYGSHSYFESKLKGLKMQHEVGDLCEWVWVILDQGTEMHGKQVWKKVGGNLDAIFTLFFMKC